MEHPFHLLDVFAEPPMGGNLHLVVHDADAVSDEVMAAFARRLRLSETSFVQSPREGGDYRHRIWMPAGEIPFAGHPSVGTAVAVALRRGVRQARFVQETGSGRHEIAVEVDSSRRRAVGRLRQNPLEVGAPVEPGPILRALGLRDDDLGTLPVRLVTTGMLTLAIEVASVEALGRIEVDAPVLDAIVAPLAGGRPLNLYVVAQAAGPAVWRARCIAPDIPGGEDAATGSAAGPFGAYLASLGGPQRITIDQGVEMGDPSRIDVDCADGIVVSGTVLVRGEGVISLGVSDT